ncbi:MAG: DUF429 domain-containing protein [Burkholderiaceae bacterium]|nr:DUF429 domain-containing protein [Burkholderiaceae bacterium]
MVQVVGCDFSSSPCKRKPIVFAIGSASNGRLTLSKLERLESLDGFSAWLTRNTDWVGVFDLPFGLPRELVEQLGWPDTWQACIEHYASLPRDEIRRLFKTFCDARPVGGKFAHRATDRPAGSSPSMKWVNPPVAYMLHAGTPRLLAAGVHLPGLHDGDPLDLTIDATGAKVPKRVALEGYPGLLAREVLDKQGKRSYKSDDQAKQTPERLIARKDLVTALELGQTRLKLRLKLSHAQRDALVDDASGDSLDAVLCMLQAAWAQQQHALGASTYGLPSGFDPLEGWIVTA